MPTTRKNLVTAQTDEVERVNTETPAAKANSSGRPRMFFIDNLRVLLIVLVVLHHLAIIYGAPGDFFYTEGQPDMAAFLVFTLFVGVNQAFFMGFFFMISGFFTPGSYDRKGPGAFLKDRLLRLGIPLLFFIIVIEPLMVYALAVTVGGFQGSLWNLLAQYWGDYDSLGVGPLWFVETLLIFAAIYAAWRLLTKPATNRVQPDSRPPGDLTIAIFALALGVATFVVRIWLPVGWYWRPLSLQLPFFPQYIALFVVGMVAYRRNWFLGISAATGRLWIRVALVLCVVVWPLFLVASAVLEWDMETVFGGVHYQSFVYSVWEQSVGVAMSISLLVWFRRRFNHQGKLTKAMAASAYAVYIIMAPVSVLVALLLRDVSLYPLLKFVLVSVITVPLCFLIGNYLRKIPLVRRIL